MPPPVFFTREYILEEAFKLALKEGVNNITARLLAKEIKGSTMAIYHSYHSIEELKDEIMNKALYILKEYIEKKYTDDDLINMAVGEICFATEYTGLYKALFIDNNKYKPLADNFHGNVLEKFFSEPFFSHLSREEIESMFYKLMIVIKGFGVQICAGYRGNMSVEKTALDVHELCSPIVYHAINRTNLKKVLVSPAFLGDYEK